MEEKIISWQHKSIFYRIGGNGKTVVLLHGFGEEGNVWKQQEAVLKKNFRVIIPDIPGSGSSDLIEDAGIDVYAAAVKNILDAEKLLQHKVSMIGHSMGGYIALAFAEKYPEYLNSIGLFHSTAYADSSEKIEVRKKAIEFIADKGAYAFLKTSIPGLFADAFTQTNMNAIEALIEKGKGFTAAALIQYYTAMLQRLDRTGVLKNFNRPVLFIAGAFDKAVPLQHTLEQCSMPAISEIHILKNSTHMGMWEEKAKANAALLNFLSEI